MPGLSRALTSLQSLMRRRRKAELAASQPIRCFRSEPSSTSADLEPLPTQWPSGSSSGSGRRSASSTTSRASARCSATTSTSCAAGKYDRAICYLPHDGVNANAITGKRYDDHLREPCVSFDRFWPWKFASALRPPPRRRICPTPSFGLKLFIDAHASISVPSTEK